jgi:hypothetical protein
MFTCFHCKIEKPDEQKAGISVLLKIGYLTGAILLLVLPFWWAIPEWPTDACKDCKEILIIKSCFGLFFFLVAFGTLVVIFAIKANHS